MHGNKVEYGNSQRLIRQLIRQDFPNRTSALLPLPLEAAVIEIAHDLRSLICPEHWLSCVEESLESAADRCFARVEHQLRKQIEIGIRHAQSAKLRIHRATLDEIDDVAAELTSRFLGVLPQLQKLLQDDIQAAIDRDPAATTREEIIISYPGIHAVLVYRIAHALLNLDIPYLPRILTEWAHRETGIDIHPGARIGPSFFIDHGTGVVIGETCVIGSSVTLYQGVTLGAWSFPRDKEGRLIRGTQRHPTLEDNVTVYSNATILGGRTVVGAGSQVGSSVTLSRSIPANTIVTIEEPSLQFRESG
ncbi:MAG: serine acetyltransferase [Fuerstiella sp.]|nr:serine acetyltransferase [Fuerstiella sp.]